MRGGTDARCADRHSPRRAAQCDVARRGRLSADRRRRYRGRRADPHRHSDLGAGIYDPVALAPLRRGLDHHRRARGGLARRRGRDCRAGTRHHDRRAGEPCACFPGRWRPAARHLWHPYPRQADRRLRIAAVRYPLSAFFRAQPHHTPAVPSAHGDQTMAISRFDLTQPPGPRMSRCVVRDNTVYLAGLTASDTTQDIKGQTKQILNKIAAYLAHAGTINATLLPPNLSMKNMALFADMNSVWNAWVDPENPPARACVKADLARPELLVEIMVTAAK